MKIEGKPYKVLETYDDIITVPDCFVTGPNKLGTGHGEAKLYFGTKTAMREFFGGERFIANCFLLRSDLLSYLNTLKGEYFNPTQDYLGKSALRSLWKERVALVENLPEIVDFKITDQYQIKGPRGYINSNDEAYQLLRELSLPLVSYISAMQIADNSGQCSYYFKLFVDFDAISERANVPLVFTYGRGKSDSNKGAKPTKQSSKDKNIQRAREGQGKYRELLLEECPFCPITMVNDERLLIASHIKPWAVSTDVEKIDPKNGFMLSPLYDKLFDKGLITFSPDKKMLVSNWLSPKNIERLGLIDGKYYARLPIDEKRADYLKYHKDSVFKG